MPKENGSTSHYQLGELWLDEARKAYARYVKDGVKEDWRMGQLAAAIGTAECILAHASFLRGPMENLRRSPSAVSEE